MVSNNIIALLLILFGVIGYAWANKKHDPPKDQ